jgi:hypothetical protein
MEPGPLVERLKDAGVSLADIQDLPRKLHLPPGITRILRVNGVLRRAGRDQNGCVTWDRGPLYTILKERWTQDLE